MAWLLDEKYYFGPQSNLARFQLTKASPESQQYDHLCRGGANYADCEAGSLALVRDCFR